MFMQIFWGVEVVYYGIVQVETCYLIIIIVIAIIIIVIVIIIIINIIIIITFNVPHCSVFNYMQRDSHTHFII